MYRCTMVSLPNIHIQLKSGLQTAFCYMLYALLLACLKTSGVELILLNAYC